MTDTLSRIESNGLKINLDTLAQIEKEYEEVDECSEVESVTSSFNEFNAALSI